MKTSATAPSVEAPTPTRELSASSPELQDAWARQLAALLSSVGPLRPLPTPPAQLPSGSDGDAAPRAPKVPGPAPDPQFSDAGSDKPLTLTVSTEALGEVSILIDRAQGGVRVVLGVEEHTAQSALLPEKAALLRALAAVGVNVHSVSIVRQPKVGTVLAERDLQAQEPLDNKANAAAFQKDPRQSKKAKRINFVG